MKKYFYIILALLIFGCSDEDTKDSQKPIISMDNGGFPTNCDTIKRGEPFTFKATFSDNISLGGYSLDIHNNFDNHAHSTDVEECKREPNKKPEKPFKLTKTYTIEGSPKTYTTTQEFTIGTEYDSGYYHFMIQVTDMTGWSANKGISIFVE